ncbi:MAG: DNA polymerase I [Nevskiales bacterium]
MPEAPLILIDGSGWLYRAYHALPDFTNSKGEPTGAVFGMGNMLRKLLREYQPKRIAMIFDTGGETFRHALYADYKANRPPIPEGLSAQFPRILELVETLGLPVLQIPEVEADDVIGTLAATAQGAGCEVLIVTSDKDLAQLVDERVKLLDTMKNRLLDRAGVIEKFGVPPERITDYLALVGDTSDNIPGVPKVGEKTATKWLGEFGTLDALMARAGEVSGKIGENLRASLKQLPMARELATLRCDLQLPFSWDQLRPQPSDPVKLGKLLQELEFKQWSRELGGDSPAVQSNSPLPLREGARGRGDSEAASPTLLEQRSDAQYHSVLDDTALTEMLGKLEAAELICFDTETDALDAHGANLVGLSFAVTSGEAWYVPLGHDYLGAPKQLSAELVLSRLKPLLQDARKPKLGQHIKYDCEVLVRCGVQVAGIRYDTMLESYVLNATATRHDMDSLAEKYLGYKTISFQDVAGKGKNQLTFNQIELDKATTYAAEDADITLRLHEMLYPLLSATPPLQKLFDEVEMPLVPVLIAMECYGVLLNLALLKKISAELATRMDELQASAYREAGQEFNLNSPPQLQTLLFEKLQLPVIAKTPKGQPSTNEEVLEQLAEQHPLPRLILDYRALSKLRSTYTEALPQQINSRTGRVHTSYHQAVAATGRLSSSDPNLQNIPIRTAEGRRIRQAFIAPKGNTLLSVDYSQIELRLMAHFSKDPKLQQAFHDGRDIHQATAAEVFGLSIDEVKGEQRRAAKAINFGLIYGMSAFGLARQLAIGRKEAQEYIERFFARYPGVRDFMEATKTQAREQGFVETLFGRRLYLTEINSRNPQQRQYAERTAINAPLQGTAADLIKLAMIDLHSWLAEHAADVKMTMQVHDELLFELPTKMAAGLAPQIATRMCQITKLAVPLQADYGLGANWDAAHEGGGSIRI